jgi:sodium/hydrogen antiporter
MTVADLTIIAALIFVRGTLPARLERFDMTAPIVFTAAGVTHGPLAPLGVTPSPEQVKVLAEATLALVPFSDASHVGLHHLRADLAPCLRVLGIGLPLTIGLGTLPTLPCPCGDGHLGRSAGRCGTRAGRRCARRRHDGQPGGARPDPAPDQG